MTRNESFGVHKLSFLDKIIYRFRVYQLKKCCDFDHKVVADVGCGYNAVFLAYLQDKFMPKKLIAFDLKLDTDSLKEQGIIPFQSDLNKEFDLPESPDLILCTAVLEHLDNPIGFLEQAYKNLKIGGSLVLTVPSVWSQPVLEFLAFRLKLIDAHEIRDHKQYYTKSKLVEFLKKAGFERRNIHHHYFELYMNNFVLVKK